MVLPSDQGEFIPPPEESESNGQESKEVETRETAEESEAIDKATFEPEEAVEDHMDYKEAERIETALVEAVSEIDVEIAPEADPEEVITKTGEDDSAIDGTGIEEGPPDEDDMEQPSSPDGNDRDKPSTTPPSDTE